MLRCAVWRKLFTRRIEEKMFTVTGVSFAVIRNSNSFSPDE